MPMPLLPLARLCALFEEMAGKTLARAVEDGACVFRTQGVLGDWTRKKTFWNNIYYGVELSDGGRAIAVDLPLEVIQREDLRPGSFVEIIGTPTVYLKTSVVLFKLHVHAASVVQRAALPGTPRETDRNVAETISHLKALGFRRIPFPKRVDIVSVIHSKSQAANVLEDFKNELSGRHVRLETLPVAMTDASAIARAVEGATGNVLVLIRGGGDEGDFLVFQDERVVKALARKAAHRVTGLGHSGNLTYADLVADFCTTTPTGAGAYVREQVGRTYTAKHEDAEERERLAAELAGLRRSNLKWMLACVGLGALFVCFGLWR